MGYIANGMPVCIQEKLRKSLVGLKWFYTFALETATFKLFNTPFKCKYNLLKISVGLNLPGLFVTSQFQTPHTHVWEYPTVTNKLRHTNTKTTLELLEANQALLAKVTNEHSRLTDLYLTEIMARVSGITQKSILDKEQPKKRAILIDFPSTTLLEKGGCRG